MCVDCVRLGRWSMLGRMGVFVRGRIRFMMLGVISVILGVRMGRFLMAGLVSVREGWC